MLLLLSLKLLQVTGEALEPRLVHVPHHDKGAASGKAEGHLATDPAGRPSQEDCSASKAERAAEEAA